MKQPMMVVAFFDGAIYEFRAEDLGIGDHATNHQIRRALSKEFGEDLSAYDIDRYGIVVSVRPSFAGCRQEYRAAFDVPPQP